MYWKQMVAKHKPGFFFTLATQFLNYFKQFMDGLFSSMWFISHSCMLSIKKEADRYRNREFKCTTCVQNAVNSCICSKRIPADFIIQGFSIKTASARCSIYPKYVQYMQWRPELVEHVAYLKRLICSLPHSNSIS